MLQVYCRSNRDKQLVTHIFTLTTYLGSHWSQHWCDSLFIFLSKFWVSVFWLLDLFMDIGKCPQRVPEDLVIMAYLLCTTPVWKLSGLFQEATKNLSFQTWFWLTPFFLIFNTLEFFCETLLSLSGKVLYKQCFTYPQINQTCMSLKCGRSGRREHMQV